MGSHTLITHVYVNGKLAYHNPHGIKFNMSKKVDIIKVAKAAIRSLLVRLGFVAPTVDEALAPLQKIVDGLTAARDAHTAKANAKRREANTASYQARCNDRSSAKAAKSLEEFSKAL